MKSSRVATSCSIRNDTVLSEPGHNSRCGAHDPMTSAFPDTPEGAAVHETVRGPCRSNPGRQVGGQSSPAVIGKPQLDRSAPGTAGNLSQAAVAEKQHCGHNSYTVYQNTAAWLRSHCAAFEHTRQKYVVGMLCVNRRRESKHMYG